MSSPVLITDAKYRSSVGAAQALGEKGYTVYVCQTEKEASGIPAVFRSKYVKESIMIPASVDDEDYPDRLGDICEKIKDAEDEVPVLFPIGARTLSRLSEQGEKLEGSALFTVSSPSVLEHANDKRLAAKTAKELGIPTPEEYELSKGELPPGFPVVIKPRCGEKFGLHAAQRYRKAYNETEYKKAYEEMSSYDSSPIVQELITGEARGVCVIMDRNCTPVYIMCHERIREYPIEGGPSSCCKSIWDEKLVAYSVKLLRALGFKGIAMVEFKGGKLLEINPRIWGSFPLTYKTGSGFSQAYVRVSKGENLPEYSSPDYRVGTRMRFILNDTLACLGYIRNGQAGKGFSGLVDNFRPGCKEAVFSFKDPKPFFTYIANSLKKRSS